MLERGRKGPLPSGIGFELGQRETLTGPGILKRPHRHLRGADRVHRGIGLAIVAWAILGGAVHGAVNGVEPDGAGCSSRIPEGLPTRRAGHLPPGSELLRAVASWLAGNCATYSNPQHNQADFVYGFFVGDRRESGLTCRASRCERPPRLEHSGLLTPRGTSLKPTRRGRRRHAR